MVTAPAPDRTLADIAADVARDAASGADLHAALLAATVVCERGERPGFTALGAPDAGLICIYSSVEQLALARGTVAWFELRGADLLDLLPAGYDLMLDIAGPTPLRLSSAALRRTVTIDVAETTDQP